MRSYYYYVIVIFIMIGNINKVNDQLVNKRDVYKYYYFNFKFKHL